MQLKAFIVALSLFNIVTISALPTPGSGRDLTTLGRRQDDGGAPPGGAPPPPPPSPPPEDDDRFGWLHFADKYDAWRTSLGDPWTTLNGANFGKVEGGAGITP